MIPMITALGLFRDEDHLRADNFAKNAKRKFRTGMFSPFSANLAFVLHKCDTGHDNINSKYKVHVLVNELPVGELDAGELACSRMNRNNRQLIDDGSLCDLDHFKSQLKAFLSQDIHQACAHDATKRNDAIKTDL